MSDRVSAAKSLSRPTVRLVLAVFILAAAGWVGRSQWVKRQLIVAENRAVEMQNQAQYAQAAMAYEAIRPEVSGESAKRVTANLAACYAAMAEDPALPAPEVFELYRRAYGLDPAAVTNPAILKRLKGGP
jgi:predicted negative regulator of RcsB-dependent stress response